MVAQKSVLILSADPLIAALLGAAVELEDLDPVFASDHESPRDALLRLRPRLVLIDCQHGSACAESFFGPAMMTGARIVVFGAQWLEGELRELAERHNVTALTLPADYAQLARIIAEAVPA